MYCSYNGMIERIAIRTAHIRTAAVAVCLMGRIALGQTTDPGAANPPTAPSTVQPAYTPLTGSERLHIYERSLFGPMALFSGAVSAGWGQLRDRPYEWGQGAEGYGRRYASGYSQRFVRETLYLGSSSLLHQDGRYFRATDATTGGRLRHALVSTILARKDDGSNTFASARIGSMLASSFISRTWQPNSTGSVNSALENFSISVGVAAGFNVAREFLPKKFRFIK
jgi:hypothetical protein